MHSDRHEKSPFNPNPSFKTQDWDSNLMSTMMQTGPVRQSIHPQVIARIEEEEEKDISIDEFKPETPKTKKVNSGIKIWWRDEHYNQVRKSILKARPGSETP